MGDEELSLIAHYLERGHALEELLGLTAAERMFFGLAAELEAEAYGAK